jgi:hypothetical protein
MSSWNLTGVNIINTDKEESDKNSEMKQTKFSKFITKNQKKFDKTQSMMLDYLVTEETHYTDMEKIEEYLNKKNTEDNKLINEKNDKIQKKKDILFKATVQINQALVNAMKIEEAQNFTQRDNLLIEELKKQIEKQEHDLMSYQETKNSFYVENYILKKKFKENVTLGDMTQVQFKKYAEVGKNAKNTFTLQKNLLKEMKEYDINATKNYDKELNKKKVSCMKLENDVMDTKNQINSLQDALTDLRNLIIEKRKSVDETKLRNEKYFRDYKEKIREYLRDFIMYQQILRKLKVHDVDSIIVRYKEESIKYSGNTTVVR